uniref:Uncharacterized protein n=1 Tax=Romanomermis culicivorax TaxID=13658 RepID=A0A915IEH2_ROMCU
MGEKVKIVVLVCYPEFYSLAFRFCYPYSRGAKKRYQKLFGRACLTPPKSRRAGLSLLLPVAKVD